MKLLIKLAKNKSNYPFPIYTPNPKNLKTQMILLLPYPQNIKTFIIAKYVGAEWSANNASGIQSLVWRHQWEERQNEKHKQLLITYNTEDCLALKLLTDK